MISSSATLFKSCLDSGGLFRRPTSRAAAVTGGGKLYLAVILDLFSRMVVGWALSAANDRHLALRALEQALRRRCPDAGLLHHTDQGSPYASKDYQRVLAANGITCSMSRRGSSCTR